MSKAINKEEFQEITKMIPSVIRNKLIDNQFASSVFIVLQEDLTMAQLQELHGELFANKTFKEKSFNSFYEFLTAQPNYEDGDVGVYIHTFIEEMKRIEEIVSGANSNFKNYSGKLLSNINLMMDDHKNEIIDKVVYDRIRPFENLRTIFNMRYAFISGTKDKNTLYEDLKSELGPWLCGKVQFPEKTTLKEFNLFYNPKTLKTDRIFSELL